MNFPPNFQGEELRKLIASPAYVECSSKTQQVFIDLDFCQLLEEVSHSITSNMFCIFMY